MFKVCWNSSAFDYYFTSLNLFTQLVLRCEDRLLSELRIKVDDFIGLLEDEEWMPKEPNEV